MTLKRGEGRNLKVKGTKQARRTTKQEGNGGRRLERLKSVVLALMAGIRCSFHHSKGRPSSFSGGVLGSE